MNNGIAIKTTISKNWKVKTLAIIGAVISALVLPQLCHAIGAITGLGTALGEVFLPMHLAIFVVGWLCGSIAGATSAIASVGISFALTGMPNAAILPFIMIELVGYGVTTGLLAKSKINPFFVVLIAQIVGRIARSIAVIVAFYGLGGAIPVASIWTSILVGLPGILLQLAVLPLLMYWINKKARNEQFK